ncbi:VOC family protein [Haloferax namakaokahaiae]|uniref:VOC family protein n=1 Tax=Haloferax namakaokahaiae TaxID=1748331 RepID=A0ABD5ZH97_9EURY
MSDTSSETGVLPAASHLGRIALRVGSLDTLVPFYRDVLGFEVERTDSRATLSAGHNPVVVLDEAPDAPPRARDEAGLFHLAIRVPTRAALGDALRRIRDGAQLSGASDHLVSEALYLRDPEGNGIEVYWDRAKSEWPHNDDGTVAMDTLPLALDDVLDEAAGDDSLPAGTDLGHVHLEVTDLSQSVEFYTEALGMNLRNDTYPSAAFVAAGDYHHHVGLNRWNDRRTGVTDGRGIEWFEVVVPDADALDVVSDALGNAGFDVRTSEEAAVVTDPDGIEVRLIQAD